MKVDVTLKSVAIETIFNNPDTLVLLDANFFIPPSREAVGAKPIAFAQYKEFWLEPLFSEFSNLTVHESVYDELVADCVKEYVDIKRNGIPPGLQIYFDSMLSETEKAVLQSYILKIAKNSQYIPEKDNAKDRGEVRSLAFMAAKNMLYFASSDSLPIRLVEEADKLHTDLENMSVLKFYEVIYYLYKTGRYNKTFLRALYKYQYYLTKREKAENPDWGQFVTEMDKLYNSYKEK